MMKRKNNIIDTENKASRLDALIEATIDGMITFDENGDIESVNDATCKLFGYTEGGLLEKNLSLLMPRQEVYNICTQHFLGTNHPAIKSMSHEIMGRKKDGKLFPFRLKISHFQLNGQRMFMGVIHDLTEQRHTESDLRNSLKKEKEWGLMKNRFISMASHEFRTPLSTILSSASLMVQYTQTEQQDKRERHFKKIKSGVDILNTILNDFFSLDRLEAGLVDVQNETFDIYAFCREVKNEFQSALKQGQTIKIYPIDDKEDVYFDKKILKLILVNLLSNASKYSEESSEIDFYIKKHGNFIQISISDKGIGIPKEEQKYLFSRFFRASNVTNIKGTGLGLHIAKRYADLVDGNMRFESVLDEGSTFTFSFKIGDILT